MADPNEYEGLTDEEIAALKEAEAESEPDEEVDGDGNGEQQAEQEADEQANEPEKPDSSTEDEPAEGPTEVSPPLQARAPDDLKDRLDALTARETDLQAKFDDGELTSKEFREGLAKIAEEREGVKWEQRKAELASEMKVQAETNAWQRDVNEFMASTGAGIAKSRAALVAFDEHVKAVTADPANANLSNRQQLTKAFKLFSDEMSAAFGTKPAAQPAATKETQKPKTPREVPPILAKIPAAEVETTDNGRWAALDALSSKDPIAYEQAISRLKPHEMEEYANYAVG